jgi:REP element-mobilizing transposase RayT
VGVDHFWHNRIRQEASLYADPGRVASVVVGVNKRRPVFSSPLLAEAAKKVLTEHAEKLSVPLIAYCLMPDHVHLLVSPSPECNIPTFVGQVKNLAQRELWKLGLEGPVSQRSFWDHFVRDEEDLKAAALYILENPVRKGIVEAWQDYPFSGTSLELG